MPSSLILSQGVGHLDVPVFYMSDCRGVGQAIESNLSNSAQYSLPDCPLKNLKKLSSDFEKLGSFEKYRSNYVYWAYFLHPQIACADAEVASIE